MAESPLQPVINRIIEKIDTLIPSYASNPADAFAGGNVAVCIIDEKGNVYGRIWGTDKVRGRNFFRLAWTKASQVWITKMKTGEFEKRLFNGEFDESKYGIQKPDLIGWEGGQPVSLSDGTVLSVGFSGFRGINDLEIVSKAVAGM
ncbi:MAG TPA: heme-binding protein [Bacteroidota bacterium]|nr:heme-binding protein [Bacteroidota bacterium]